MNNAQLRIKCATLKVFVRRARRVSTSKNDLLPAEFNAIFVELERREGETEKGELNLESTCLETGLFGK